MENGKKVFVTISYAYYNQQGVLVKDNLMHEVLALTRSHAINAAFNYFNETLSTKFGINHWVLNGMSVTGDKNPQFWS